MKVEDAEVDLLDQAWANNSPQVTEFVSVGEDHYRLSVLAIGVVFDIDRIRRDRYGLTGELRVQCQLPGVFTVDGTLSIADLNLSSSRARSERGKMLAERARTHDLDWISLVEELCQRVLLADRIGQPAIDLREIARPAPADDIEIDGLVLPRRHPSIIFGDGGDGKSYLALYLAGRMAQRQMRVALFDWELASEDHRDRLERLFGSDMPQILYARCELPLVFETDRLRRIVRENSIDFAVFDSVAYACDGPPEAAEVATRYFRANRQIGGGSLHVAHVNKSENADRKPFGSAFWHNGARSTWFVRRTDGAPDGASIHLALYNRKANLGRLLPPVGFTVSFTRDRTRFDRSQVGASLGPAAKLSIYQRIVTLLNQGPMTPTEIAKSVEADLESVKRTIRRYKKQLVENSDGRISLRKEIA